VKPPPVRTTVGADAHPEPGVVTVIAVTAPPEMVALAKGSVVQPPVKETVGAPV
jgi:hypothetical protein